MMIPPMGFILGRMLVECRYTTGKSLRSANQCVSLPLSLLLLRVRPTPRPGTGKKEYISGIVCLVPCWFVFWAIARRRLPSRVKSPGLPMLLLGSQTKTTGFACNHCDLGCVILPVQSRFIANGDILSSIGSMVCMYRISLAKRACELSTYCTPDSVIIWRSEAKSIDPSHGSHS